MNIKIWDGEINDNLLAFELRRIANLIEEGYTEGDISNECYSGWWKK